MSLYREGAWKAVDAAFVHPPASTEQILHADRIDNARDAPIRIEIPDLRGMLGANYEPVSNGSLGEQDLFEYLAHYVDPEVARIAADGWGGCSYVLYQTESDSNDETPTQPSTFALVSAWDSEDDAVEFFGGLIGALEARYPDQVGDSERSTQDQVIWLMDGGRRTNVLRLRERQVICLEGMPEPRLQRVLAKLDSGVLIDDPTPEVRARQKANLPWNRKSMPLATSALRPQIDLPAGWTRVDPPADPLVILEATHDASHLRLIVDHTASNELRVDGYTHRVAAKLQEKGRAVYVQTDVQFQREDRVLYQHVFSQTENDTEMVYYIGAADLNQGFGHLVLWGPEDPDQPMLEKTFYELLRSMEFIPEAQPAAAPPNPSRAGIPTKG